MMSILYSGAPIPSAKHGSASEYVLNKTITLLSLQDNNSTGSQVCHYRTVTGRNGLSISSECNHHKWTRYDRDNINLHFCSYILNKFGPIQRSIRIFLLF